MNWFKRLFGFREYVSRGLLVDRDGTQKYMREVDPELFDVIGPMPWNVGIVIWCKKYPQDIPDTSKFDWLREAIKY